MEISAPPIFIEPKRNHTTIRLFLWPVRVLTNVAENSGSRI